MEVKVDVKNITVEIKFNVKGVMTILYLFNKLDYEAIHLQRDGRSVR